MTDPPYDYGELGREYWIDEGGAMMRSLCEWSLADLQHFLSSLDALIEREEKDEVAEIQRRLGNRVDWSEEYPWWWQATIGTQLRRASLIMLMSATEFHLIALGIKAAFLLKLSEPPSRNAIIKNLRKFFADSAKFVTPTAIQWETLEDLYFVRNALVHRGGMVSDAPRLASLQRRAPGIQLRSGFVDLSTEFCNFAHGAVDAVFKSLLAEYEALCRRLKRDVA